MVRAGLGTWPPPTPPSSPPRPRPSACANWNRTPRPDRGAGLVPGRVHRRAGARRGRGLQRGVLADAPDRDHPGRRRRAHRLGQAGRHAPARCWRRWPPGRSRSRWGGVICLWTGKLPQEYRDAADEQLLAAVRRRAGAGGPGGPVRGDVRAGPRGPARSGPGPGVRRPRGEAGHHDRRRRGPARRPDRRVRRRGGRGAGRAGRPGRERRRPDQGPAVPRRAGRGDAPADRGRPAAGAGRAAGQGLGAHLPRRPDAARRRLRAACRSSGPSGSGPGGPPAARTPPRPARATGRGWTGTPPRRSPATPRWPPSSPATSTWTPWRTWSGSASNWTSSARAATPARPAPPRPGPRWSKQ